MRFFVKKEIRYWDKDIGSMVLNELFERIWITIPLVVLDFDKGNVKLVANNSLLLILLRVGRQSAKIEGIYL